MQKNHNNKCVTLDHPPAGLAGRFAVLTALLMALGVSAVQSQPSLDDLLDIEQPAEQAPPVDDHPETPLDDGVVERLSGEEAADAFAQAVRQMRSVSERLGGQHDAGIGTQRIQIEIMQKLDQVIAQAQEQQQQQSSSSSSSSSGEGQGQAQQQDTGSGENAQAGQDQQSGQDAQGEAGQQQAAGDAGGANNSESPADGEGTPLGQQRDQWGKLPPRLRSELDEGSAERFSPVYQDLTEAYYRRLAEEAR